MNKIAKKELYKILEQHTMWVESGGKSGKLAYFKYANLKYANLMRVNLMRADLTDADLTDADLTGANLTDADLMRANLMDASLTDSDLGDAFLKYANLKYVYLIGANLKYANLKYSDLTGADLMRANLTGADLTGADLTDSDFYKTNVKDTVIQKNTEFKYDIYYSFETKTPFMSIGCMNKSIEEWGQIYENKDLLKELCEEHDIDESDFKDIAEFVVDNIFKKYKEEYRNEK